MFWITWFDWHRSLIENKNVNLIHSIRSARPLWSLDQKNESYGLWYGGQVQGIFLGEKHLGCYLWHGNMMGFLTVLLLRNCGRNRWVIKNDPLIPTTPSSTPLRHGLMENKEESTIRNFFSLFLIVQERYLQQILRYKRDGSSNSADDSPRLLNALSS